MLNEHFLPLIVPVFDVNQDASNAAVYGDIIRHTLKKILPCDICFSKDNDPEVLADQEEQFQSILPYVTAESPKQLPGDMTFFAVSRYRANSFKFFFDMVSSWLVPGRRLNVVLIYAADFRMPEISDNIYTLCEIVIRVESKEELDQILSNLPIIETELRLGIESSYDARRILEIKGLSTDEKTALIQEYISYLIKRLPRDFDHDVLTEMQHVLVMCREEFKALRECRHLSRIISFHYLFRKALRESVKNAPQKRHLSLKLFKARIKNKDGFKTVLAVLVGVNFFRDKEVFDKAHILKAIQNYIPMAHAVEGSFFANRRGTEHICTLYLEIEKNLGEDFTAEEIRMLRQKLPSDLKDRIEHLMHPVFMSRNEEEVIRNILSLSSQIKYLRDIPQVFISFDEQTHANLFFTIILVRVLKPDALSIQDQFKQSDTFLEYIHDRCQYSGSLRRKYKKEATVFRVKFPKEQFIRVDHSIDLNKARQVVVSELCCIVGEVRDFNGGIISKQNELLCEVRDLLANDGRYNDLLLENFFYSLAPVIMRSVLDPFALRSLFSLMLESIEDGFFNDESYAIKIELQPEFVFVMIKAEDRSIKEELTKAINKLQLHSSELANSYVSVYDIVYLGYIYRSDEHSRQQHFCQTVQMAVANWGMKKRKHALAGV